MDPTVDDLSRGVPGFVRCAECDGRLAHDQRYCVTCGARRGALPAMAAAMIAGTPIPQAAVVAPAPPAPITWLPAPRLAAVAVMSVLGFGVLVGASVQPVDTGTPAAVALLPAAPAAAPVPVAPVTVPVTEPPVESNTALDSSVDTGGSAPASASSKTRDNSPAPAGGRLPDVKHVFLIVLSGHGFEQAFGEASPAPYLAKTLTAGGELLANYHAVAQGELANGIALISGQGPTVQTAGNCPTYADVAPATIGDDGQVRGDGCVYPARATTIGDQLTAKGKSWKAYVEDLRTGLAAGAPDCRHPALGAADGEQAPRPQDPYTTWRNPFVYFHSIIDGELCEEGLADLSELDGDLASAGSTPSLSYILPNRCHDAADTPCAPDQPAGLAAADAFLRSVVPAIQASAAYKDGGLIAITFDQAPQTGPDADSSSCCDAPLFPNLPDAAQPAPALDPVGDAPDAAPAPPTPVSPPAADPPPAAAEPPPAPTARGADGEPIGGGKVGLLLISSFVKAGSVNRVESFNHFSLLRSVEDLFGLKHLGYAADPSLLAFDKAVYNAGR